ncbi:unnamed protein product, partial [Ascophyllum nodosum]
IYFTVRTRRHTARCEADPASRAGAGAGGESARYDEGAPHARSPSEEITQKTVETMIIETTGQ